MREKRKERLESKNQPRFSQKLKGGIPMLYLFLSALRAVLYEVAVCLLRGVCRA